MNSPSTHYPFSRLFSLAEHMVRTTVRRVSVNYAALSPNMAQLNASGGDGLKRQGRKIG